MVHNAFNELMQQELFTVWRGLRRHDDVRAVVLTGAGVTSFCSGVDRKDPIDKPPGTHQYVGRLKNEISLDPRTVANLQGERVDTACYSS